MGRLFLCASCLIASQTVIACKCEKMSLSEQFAKAQIVLVGSVEHAFQPGKYGDVARLLVSRVINGDASVGTLFAIDPLFESDCAAPIIPNVDLLIFTSPNPKGAPIVSACSVRAAGPIPTGEVVIQPSPEVIDLLRAH